MSWIFLCWCICALCICSVHTVLGQIPSCSLVSSVPVLVKEEVPGTTFYSFLFSKAWTVLMFLLKHFWLGQTPFFPHPPSMPLGWDRAERMILNPELQNLNFFFFFLLGSATAPAKSRLQRVMLEFHAAGASIFIWIHFSKHSPLEAEV